MSHRILIALAVLPLLMTACGPVRGYTGSARPASEVANIQPNPYWSEIGIQVLGVDGMEVEADMSIDVLPGSRALRLQLQPYSRTELQQASGAEIQMDTMDDVEWQTTIDWTVELAAGGKYALTGTWQDAAFEVHLQDAGTRSIIDTREVQAVRRDP
jgi:hypothetical protein